MKSIPQSQPAKTSKVRLSQATATLQQMHWQKIEKQATTPELTDSSTRIRWLEKVPYRSATASIF
jgi:hypothetical protein